MKVGKLAEDDTVTVDQKDVDPETGYKDDTIAVVDGVECKTMKEAVDALGGAGGTITLVKDIDVTSTAGDWCTTGGHIKVAGDVTIEMDGFDFVIDTTTLTIEADTAKTVTLKGGNIVKKSASSAGNLTTSKVNIVLDDVYCEVAVENSTSSTPTETLTLKNESIVDGTIGNTNEFKSVTVEKGSEAAKAIKTDGGAVTVDGLVKGDITVANDNSSVVLGATAEVNGIDLGSGCAKLTVADGAKVKGAVTGNSVGAGSAININGGTFATTVNVGNSSAFMSAVNITGGTFEGIVTIAGATNSNLSISGGLFKGGDTSSAASVSTTVNCISGGVFKSNYSNGISGCLVTGACLAQIDDTAKYTAPATSPINDAYYYVGSAAISENLAKLTKGELTVTAGDATVSSIGDEIKVTVSGGTLTMDNVKLKLSGTVTGEKINELNELIEKAEALQYQGGITADELKTLIEAYSAATPSGGLAPTGVSGAIRALEKAMEGLEVAPDKAALQTAVDAAEKLQEEDYTADSWKAADLATAIQSAKDVLAKTSPTEADITAAAKALEDAQAKLVKKGDTPVQPEIPAAPANGTGWSHASDGTWYYYKNKELQKSAWIYGKGGLWYYVDKDGKMLEGFQKIDGVWYFLQNDDTNGTRGTIVTSKDGWIYNAAIPGGCAYARNVRNTGHFGEITWTQAGGDFVNGHFVKGDPAA